MLRLIIIMLAAVFTAVQAYGDFRVLAVGDTGKGNSAQYAVGQTMASTCAALDCKFALMLGDNIYDVGINSPTDPQMITKFEKPYANVDVPFYVALGNHDYGKRANEWVKGDHQVAYSKLNPKYILPAHYYSFDYENALFLVLDTSRLFHAKDVSKQIQFVKDTLARNTKKWVVVIAHHPYISNGKHGNAGNYDGVPIAPYSGKHVKELVENELCAYTDLFISGHDHTMQTLPGTKKCQKPIFVVSGSGASTKNDLKGKNPALFQKAAIGFASLSFSKNELSISHINVSGRVEHTHTISK